MRIVLLIVFILSLSAKVSYSAIEIYAAGKKFDSLEDYKVSRQHILAGPMEISGPIPEIRQAPFMSKEDRQNLNKISYNSGISHVFIDFQQNWQDPQPRFIVNSDELRDAIRDTIANQHQAALLISDPKKMRILSLVPQDNMPFNSKTQDGQN